MENQALSSTVLIVQQAGFQDSYGSILGLAVTRRIGAAMVL